MAMLAATSRPSPEVDGALPATTCVSRIFMLARRPTRSVKPKPLASSSPPRARITRDRQHAVVGQADGIGALRDAVERGAGAGSERDGSLADRRCVGAVFGQ